MHHDIGGLAKLIESMSEEIASGLFSIDERLRTLEDTVNDMAMTVADLDAALSTFEADQLAALAEIDTAAKVGTSADLTPEVTRIQTAQTSLKSAADAVKALDTTPPVTPVPPVKPTP
jgi:uncharacterized phage infection (PIP) family protein YhgE